MDRGIDRDSISIAMKDAEGGHLDHRGHRHPRPEHKGATAGAVSGAGVGARWSASPWSAARCSCPGLGTFLIGGPIAAALTGAGIGAASGGLIGGLIGAGIPEDEAHHYASGIERGGIFVSAHVPEGQVADARRIFDEEGSLADLP